eukprot:6674766-Pyramimonas_sp.AAC.1
MQSYVGASGILVSTAPRIEEQRRIIVHIRHACALYMTGNHDEYRNLNEDTGACRADRFPACVQKRNNLR